MPPVRCRRPLQRRLLLFLLLLVVAALVGTCGASEFPERECCDSVYPTLPDLAVPPSDSDFAAAVTAAGPEADAAGGIYGNGGGGGDSDGDTDEGSVVPGVIGVGTPGEHVNVFSNVFFFSARSDRSGAAANLCVGRRLYTCYYEE